jgi:putative chitinase
MNPSVEKLSTIFPLAPIVWIEECVKQLPAAGLNTPEKFSSFMAQVAHESREFTALSENLNYSAARMTQVWPIRFPTIESAEPYAHRPESLANHVYANRMGNRSEQSGDGWRYRGRGPVQITGRKNYYTCQNDTGLGLIDNPDLLLTPAAGIRSALWFWEANRLNRYDSDTDVRLETRAINGGETGLKLRQSYFDHCLEALK